MSFESRNNLYRQTVNSYLNIAPIAFKSHLTGGFCRFYPEVSVAFIAQTCASTSGF